MFGVFTVTLSDKIVHSDPLLHGLPYLSNAYQTLCALHSEWLLNARIKRVLAHVYVSSKPRVKVENRGYHHSDKLWLEFAEAYRTINVY